MIISQKLMKIFGFHVICYPQVNVFQKVILPQSLRQRSRKSKKMLQKSNICENFENVDHFESLHEGTMSFHFVIFSEFGSQIMTSGKINDVRSGSQLVTSFGGVAFFQPYVRCCYYWSRRQTPGSQDLMTNPGGSGNLIYPGGLLHICSYHPRGRRMVPVMSKP